MDDGAIVDEAVDRIHAALGALGRQVTAIAAAATRIEHVRLVAHGGEAAAERETERLAGIVERQGRTIAALEAELEAAEGEIERLKGETHE
jgi:hypothetical protein